MFILACQHVVYKSNNGNTTTITTDTNNNNKSDRNTLAVTLAFLKH